MSTSIYAGAGIGVLDFPENYFPSDGYSGVHDPMHVKILLLTQKSTRGAIVTCELPSIRPWNLTDELRAYSAGLLDVPYENCWLVMTHDLSAPHVPRTDSGAELHMQVLRDAVHTAAEQAMQSLQPVTVRSGDGYCNINANRDMESVDGWWVGIEGNGPSNKTITMLRFDGEDDHPVAILYSYPIKSSVLEMAVMSDGRRYASGDVTGRADSKAEEILGCPVLFVMGAAGDQVPRRKANYLALDADRRFCTVDLHEEGYKILEELSGELAQAVCDAAGKTSAEPDSTLVFTHFSFHADGQLTYPNDMPSPPVSFYAYPPTPGEDIPVWILKAGSTVILGLKPEVTTPVFDLVRASSPFVHTAIAALCNGGQGYIASDFDYDRFTYPGLKTPFRRGTDALFIRNTVEQLIALAGSK